MEKKKFISTAKAIMMLISKILVGYSIFLGFGCSHKIRTNGVYHFRWDDRIIFHGNKTFEFKFKAGLIYEHSEGTWRQHGNYLILKSNFQNSDMPLNVVQSNKSSTFNSIDFEFDLKLKPIFIKESDSLFVALARRTMNIPIQKYNYILSVIDKNGNIILQDSLNITDKKVCNKRIVVPKFSTNSFFIKLEKEGFRVPMSKPIKSKYITLDNNTNSIHLSSEFDYDLHNYKVMNDTIKMLSNDSIIGKHDVYPRIFTKGFDSF